MGLIQLIKNKLSYRFIRLQAKFNNQKMVDFVIDKYNLNDPIEQKKIITHHNLICEGNGGFGRKYKALVQDKINFMIRYNIIKVKL